MKAQTCCSSKLVLRPSHFVDFIEASSNHRVPHKEGCYVILGSSPNKRPFFSGLRLLFIQLRQHKVGLNPPTIAYEEGARVTNSIGVVLCRIDEMELVQATFESCVW